jgi:hypothetical protein
MFVFLLLQPLPPKFRGMKPPSSKFRFSPFRSISLGRLGALLGLVGMVVAPVPVFGIASWTDLDGQTFKGDPAGIVGPTAIFRTRGVTGRHVLLSRLSPEDCVRFHGALSKLPARADSWARASGRVTDDCIGNVGRLKDGNYVAEDLAGLPEPEILIVFFATFRDGRSWGLLGDAGGPLRDLMRDFPGEVAALYVGYNHNPLEHVQIPRDMSFPGLVSEANSLPRLHSIKIFAPGAGTGLVALTRHGGPLALDVGKDKESVERVLLQVRAFLEAGRPDNARSWPHLAHYHRSVRRALAANDELPPVAVGSALRSAVLAEHGVEEFTARLEVDAEGKVTAAKIAPGPGIPAKLIPAVEQALQATPVVPAVERGRFVAGTLELRFPDGQG